MIEEKFIKAAESGELQYQRYVAWRYSTGTDTPQDDKKAFYWFLKAAEQGGAEDQDYVGWCYYSGQGATQDYEKAFNMFLKAAKQGYAPAEAHLGKCYYLGHGVQQDHKKAYIWCLEASIKGIEEVTPIGAEGVPEGVDEAQYIIGYMIYEGEYGDANKEDGLYWFKLARKNGNKQADEFLKKKGL